MSLSCQTMDGGYCVWCAVCHCFVRQLIAAGGQWFCLYDVVDDDQCFAEHLHSVVYVIACSYFSSLWLLCFDLC